MKNTIKTKPVTTLNATKKIVLANITKISLSLPQNKAPPLLFYKRKSKKYKIDTNINYYVKNSIKDPRK